MLVRFLVRHFLQMGGSSSKPAPVIEAPAAPTTDLSKIATVSYEAAQAAQQQAVQAAETVRQKAEEALLAANLGTEQAQSLANTFKWVAGIVGFLAVAFGAMLLYDYLAIKFGWPTIPWFTQEIAQPIIGFKVLSATYGGQDVTGAVQAKVVDNLYLPSFVVNASSLGLSAEPTPSTQTSLVVSYSVNGGPAQHYTVTVNPAASAVTNTGILPPPGAPPSTTPSGTPSAPTQAAAPSPNVGAPLLTRMWNYISGSGSSGNMLSTLYDATTTSTISAGNVPLSDQTQGAYGMQWWMFVKDWNYGFGAQKSVLVRSDPTNSSVVNPKVTLHPTENTLQVTVSLFSDGTAQAGTPVAAGSGSATEDVYVCEVADIPLQDWFAVGVSVYGRNLDVYINGNLVKTCFLPGVPKPAAGNVQLTPGGGFSGYMCGLTSVSRMLTPGDASSFYSAGTSCENQVPSGAPSTSSGYAVKFGIYNPQGKEVQQYTF
jgi:hypothetical protein